MRTYDFKNLFTFKIGYVFIEHKNQKSQGRFIVKMILPSLFSAIYRPSPKATTVIIFCVSPPRDILYRCMYVSNQISFASFPSFLPSLFGGDGTPSALHNMFSRASFPVHIEPLYSFCLSKCKYYVWRLRTKPPASKFQSHHLLV